MTNGHKSWTRAKLGDLATVRRQRSDPQAYPEMPFVGMENVEPHTMRLLGTVPARTMRSAATHFVPGDILYGRLRPYLNKVIAPRFEGLASAEFIPLTPKMGISTDFIRYRLHAADFVSFTSHLDEGDRPRVDWDGISAFDVSLPPSAEQYRIVETIDSYLTRLDDAVASLERVQAKLKKYRASVLKAAVEGRLVPTEAALARAENRQYESGEALLTRILAERRRRWQDVQIARFSGKGSAHRDDQWKTKYKDPTGPNTSQLPELPEGWRWVHLEQVTYVQLGQQRAPIHASAKKLIPYIRAANITWSGLDLSDMKMMGFPNPDRYRLVWGDVLLSEASGSPMEAGKPAIWRDEIPGACYQKTLLRVRAINAREVLPEYLRLVFLHDCVSGKFARLAPGVGIVHLTAERMLIWPVPLPPLAEQQRIVDEADRLESSATNVRSNTEAQLVRLRRLRQSVLKWAFEGRLVDQDPSEESAEILLRRIQTAREAVPVAKKTRARNLEAD